MRETASQPPIFRSQPDTQAAGSSDAPLAAQGTERVDLPVKKATPGTLVATQQPNPLSKSGSVFDILVVLILILNMLGLYVVLAKVLHSSQSVLYMLGLFGVGYLLGFIPRPSHNTSSSFWHTYWTHTLRVYLLVLGAGLVGLIIGVNHAGLDSIVGTGANPGIIGQLLRVTLFATVAVWFSMLIFTFVYIRVGRQDSWFYKFSTLLRIFFQASTGAILLLIGFLFYLAVFLTIESPSE